MSRTWIGAIALGLFSSVAQAFCGFFVAGSNAQLTNHASQVVLLREGNRTVMTMSNDYHGPLADFAMVVPVPVVLHKEDVKTLPADVFQHIDQLSAPRLVEYWERDPCAIDLLKKSGAGRGYVLSDEEEKEDDGAHGVKVEARFAVGEYDIVILSAQDSGGLEAWLREHRYRIPDGAAEALAPYVRGQMKFFVAKVNIQKVHKDEHGTVVLSPLRVQFDAQELRLPVRLGLLNAGAKQDLIVYVLHPSSRFDVANYPNVFIPTNLDVADAVRKDFASFYAELFDQTLARAKGRAVVTEYAWQTTSCDPCPTPPLDGSDLATLGASPSAGGAAGALSSWVLTRLHTRYDKATLGEDLVFREARAIAGGRAQWDGTSDGGADVADSSVNNFQGRYIIRHYWTGAVKCANPIWNRWGGPPDGGAAGPVAAQGLASAERGKIALKAVVDTPVPRLDLPGHAAPKRPKR